MNATMLGKGLRSLQHIEQTKPHVKIYYLNYDEFVAGESTCPSRRHTVLAQINFLRHLGDPSPGPLLPDLLEALFQSKIISFQIHWVR